MAQQRPIPLQWVTVGHGRLALWGRPSSKSLPFLKEQGCSRVVTLLSAFEGGEAVGKAVLMAQLAWTWIPLAGAKPPEGDAKTQLLEDIDILAARLDQGESLFIHCSAGIHRTGMVTYALLQRCGLTATDAVERLNHLRPFTAHGMHAEHFTWSDERDLDAVQAFKKN